MKVIRPGFEMISELNAETILKNIERCGRVCYKSENLIDQGTAEKFIRGIIARGHESVLEHEKITVKLICDRGVSHEIVRHRVASYSQESTRYCNYSKEKFGKELTMIRPCFWEESDPQYQIWKESMEQIEKAYNQLIETGAKPEEARTILPNSLKTEIVVTMNMRELRHFLKLRTSKASHPQMREIAKMLLAYLKEEIPVLFEDITLDS